MRIRSAICLFVVWPFCWAGLMKFRAQTSEVHTGSSHISTVLHRTVVAPL